MVRETVGEHGIRYSGSVAKQTPGSEALFGADDPAGTGERVWRRDRRLGILLALAALELVLLSTVWPGFLSPNEASRVFAAHAFVARGTFEISPELETWGTVDDVSARGEERYSNKAPGLIWAAVPVVAVVDAISPHASIHVEQYWSRVVLVSVASLAAAVLLAGWGAGAGRGRADGCGLVFVLLFASVFGVYAGTFFSHAWAGGLLLAAAWLLLGPGKRLGGRGEVAAGFLMALAAVSEYPAALLVVVLGLAGGWGSWRRMIRLAAGALVPLAAFAAYNHACFGSVLTLSSRMEAFPRYQQLAADSLLGFSLPRVGGLVGLLFSPLLGLFFFFPVLLPSLASPAAAWRKGERRIAVVLAGGIWLLPLVMSAYREWAGGASLGPRYLVLAVPFFVLGLAFVDGRAARLWMLGALVPSAAMGLLGRLVPPFAIDDVWTASTLRGWILPALRNGLWNGPIIGGGRLGAAVAMGIVALIWLLALAGVLRLWSKDVGPGPRVGAAFLTAALLVMQARAGTVTPRQKGWFLRVAPAFVVSPRHRASERGNVATP